MKKNNRDLMEQMLTAIYAKDKLEEVLELVDRTKSDKIDKKKLTDILNRQDDDKFGDEE